MPSPNKQLATLDPQLSTFYQYEFQESERWFIGHELLPVSPVALQSGTFGIIPLEELLKHDQDGKRAPGTGYQRSEMEFEDTSYATKEYGLEETIDDREGRIYANYFDHEAVVTRRLVNRVLTEAEKRIQARVMSLSQYGSLEHTPATKWSDRAAGDPVEDMETARKAFRDKFGIIPNKMVINYEVYRNLLNSQKVKAALTATGAGEKATLGKLNKAKLEEVFDISISIGGGMTNTAAQGLDANLADIWTADVLVTKVATTSDLSEPALGRVLHWTPDGSQIDGHVERYRDESVRGDIIRDRHEVDEKIFYEGFGYVIQDVL